MKLYHYCETCGELICIHCTVNKHCRPEHKYDLVGNTFERHKAEITASLEPVQEQLGVVSKALKGDPENWKPGRGDEMKKAVVKQIKDLSDNFKPDILPPCELANVTFISFNLTQAC